MSASVLLVVPPFASLDYPSLGVEILAEGCRKRGLRSEVLYSNILFARLIGYDLHERISHSSLSLMCGELVFAPAAFVSERSPTFVTDIVEQHCRKFGVVKTSRPDLDDISTVDFVECCKATEDFLSHCLIEIDRFAPEIMGVSSAFQQNMAAIAITRRVKQKLPFVTTALGGPNAFGCMGEALAAAAGCFDWVFTGEADETFPQHCVDHAHLVSPGNRAFSVTIGDSTVNLDSIPPPNYRSYLDQIRYLNGSEYTLPKALPIEFSRGCWWGQKHHCTFCGLNGGGMNSRVKSKKRSLQELLELKASYPDVRKLQVVDNIMPRGFVSTVLAEALDVLGPHFKFFFEVKSNLKPYELDAFVVGGIDSIQPGIESLSSRLLELIRKGVTAHQNIWLLRECASRKINVIWNFLVGIPGEQAPDYSAMAALLPYLVHLGPPQGMSQVVFDRFSPYFENPAVFGITNLKPLTSYAAVYPPEVDVEAVAYHFCGDIPNVTAQLDKERTKVMALTSNWIDLWRPELRHPALYCVSADNDRLFVEDTRPIRKFDRIMLDSQEAGLLQRLESPQRFEDVFHTDGYVLHRLLDLQLVISHEGRVQSVVTRPETAEHLSQLRLCREGAGIDLNQLLPILG